MENVKLATFVTGMRASSLVEALAVAGIKASAVQPKWTNKKLPPPKIEVLVQDSDLETAKAVYAGFAGVR